VRIHSSIGPHFSVPSPTTDKKVMKFKVLDSHEFDNHFGTLDVNYSVFNLKGTFHTLLV
jgi:hypothetical protein